MLSFLGVLDFILFLVAAGLIGWRFYRQVGEKVQARLSGLRNSVSDDAETPVRRSSLFSRISKPGLAVLAAAIMLFICLQGSAQVKGTEIGTVHNQLNGSISPLKPGLRIWPVDTTLIPFVTDVENYTTRKQLIVIGIDQTNANGIVGVDSASGSTGNPSVYFEYQVYAQINPLKVVDLHRRYGSDYLDKLVKPAGITAIKAVQGRHEYNYVAGNRDAFSAEVLAEMQIHLLDIDGLELVAVSDVQIINYAYNATTQAYLDKLAQAKFDELNAIQQQATNTQLQTAAEIEAQTTYNVNVKLAEGEAKAVELNADAAAYEISAKYTAEANGISLVQTSLAQSPDAYLQYQRTLKWNGTVPGVIMGEGTIPIVNIPLNGGTVSDAPVITTQTPEETLE